MSATDDGFVGAIVNDRFADDEDELRAEFDRKGGNSLFIPYAMPARLLGIVTSAVGLWMVIAPQARMGLPALRWMSRSVFPGEALVGAFVLLVGLWLSLGGRETIETAAPVHAG